ncbi:MAG: DUF4397 domain-containing protein [Gammaproteobacteria bacterium]
MRLRFALLTVIVLMLGTASCSGDGPDITWLRAMHAIPDGPSVRVTYDDKVFRRIVSFGNATNEGPETLLGGTSARMTAEYFQPRNVVGGTLLTLDVPVQVDAVSTVIFAGRFDAPEAMTVVTPRRERPLGALYFQFAHATPTLGPLDVYVTEPDTELTSTAPIATIEPLGYSDSIEVAGGAIRIRLAPAGTFDLVFDSGTVNVAEQEGVAGPAGEWLFAVAPGVTTGASQLTLIGNSGRASTTFRSVAAPAVVRAFHASVDAPAVDIVANTAPENLLFGNLEYGARSPLFAAPSGEYEVEFRAAGQPDSSIAARDVILAPDAEFAMFLVEPRETANIIVAESQTRSVANEAKLRFAHLSPESEFFTVYLTGSEDEPRSPVNRLLTDQRFSQVSGFASILPGEYFITYTSRIFDPLLGPADTPETVVFGPTPLELAGGDVFTFAIFPPPAAGETEILRQFDDRMP